MSGEGAPRGTSFRTVGTGAVVGIWYPRAVGVTVVVAVACVVLSLIGLMTGSTELALADVLRALTGGPGEAIVVGLRLPRVAAGLCVGAALGVAGAAFQSLTRNVLGSPDIIGVTAGAALGAVIGIVVAEAGQTGAVIGALAGCGAVSALTYALTVVGGSAPGQRLVLVGIGLGAFVHALTALILTHGAQHLAITGQRWLTGSLNARTWSEIVPVMVGVTILVPVIWGAARHLNVMESGDELAIPLGVSVERIRLVTVTAAVGLCAVAVVAAGPVAFIALASPHLARLLVGRGTVPVAPAALVGALSLLAADIGGQRLPETLQMPVGIATSILGGLYLAALLTRRLS